MVNFKENYHFLGTRGVQQFTGGVHLFPGGGGGGSHCLLPIETHITCSSGPTPFAYSFSQFLQVFFFRICLIPLFNTMDSSTIFVLFCLFDLILYIPSTIFQLYRDGSSWVEPVLSYDKCVLLKDHNAVTPVRLEPATLRSRVKHSTTEPLRSLFFNLKWKSLP